VWYGLVFPGGTPRTIVGKTSSEIGKLLASAEVAKRFANAGVEPQTNTPEAFSAMIAQEIHKWQKVAKAANIRVE
jgi:tripartite-type tricarboxylate transporter receptor subunit TctC